MKKADIVDQAVRRFKLVTDAEAGQRRREVDDLRFQVPEFQWDEVSRQQRAGGLTGQGLKFPLPARPTLSIPKLSQPIQLVLNQQRQAHLGVNIHPLSEDATQDTAEVIQGLYRKIERDSRAELARSWGFDRAAKAGRGFYRIDVRYDDESGNPFDFKIVIDRILYQANVYLDPGATQPDWSDGRYALVVSWVPMDVYREQYGKSVVASMDRLTFDNAYQATPQWAQGEGDEKAVLVAEYFVVETEEEEIALLDGGQVLPSDQVGKGRVLATRVREKRSVHWYKLNGHEVLDEETWLGKYIPIIPVPGLELQPFDDQRRWTGIIGPAKDGQRLYNYAASAAVELVALEPRAPFVADPRQLEGYEDWWAQANTRNFPYLPYNATVEGVAAVLPPPQRMQIDANRMGPTMALLQQADNFIQSATAIFDPALGKVDPQARSGRAILALQSQSDAGTSQYMQQLADVSMAYEARVVLDLLPKVYGRPGRIAEILDGEDQARRVMLNAPHTMDRDGNPQRLSDQAMPKQFKLYDLARGIYGVSITIGKSYQTRLQQGADEIGQILQAKPELMALIGPTYFRFRDFPGAPEIADLLKRVRDKEFPGIGQDDGDQPDAEQLGSQLQAAQQQLQELQQQLQQAAQALQTEAAKQQAMLAKAEMDNAARIEVAKIQAGARLDQADLQAQLELALERSGVLQRLLEQRHETALATADAAHEEVMADKQRAHERAAVARKAAHEVGMATLGDAHARGQAELQASLEPDDDEAGGEEPAGPEE